MTKNLVELLVVETSREYVVNMKMTLMGLA